MKSKKVNLQKVADALREQCPFIMFAMFSGLDQDGRLNWMENPELSVFLDPGTGNCYALEQILPVMSLLVSDTLCDVTLLNRVDAGTRFRASHGLCLFIREGREQNYHQFVHHASLDYRIFRAHQRRRGLIEND